jgi:2-polyprenyl-3-methyl-5-hydroxy-6-metoxy-1,4-benzoquinol methylase
MRTGQPEQAVEYWKKQAKSFDAIYSGGKSSLGRSLDRWLRKDIYDRFDWVMKHSGNLDGKSVCDLGCGSGRYLVPFAKAGAARVLGIDSAPAMIEKADQLIREANVQDRAQALVTNIADTPLEERFDVTIAVGVFDYVQDPLPFLERIRALTRERFLSTWPLVWTWRMPIRQVRLSLLGCPVYFFTRRQVEELHRKAGFKLRQIDHVGEIYCTMAEPA